MSGRRTHDKSNLGGCKDKNDIAEIRGPYVCNLLEFISRSTDFMIKPIGAAIDCCSKGRIVDVLEALLYVS